MKIASFKVTDQNGLRLILPEHDAACSNSIWTDKNKWYRSRVETLSGDTVSQGFPKFLNLNQENEAIGVSTQDVVDAIRGNQRVVATLKYDGCLLIRSVHKGTPMFRTRGAFTYGFHPEAENEMRVFLDKYPKLLDSDWRADQSLLFEWVTPKFPIVIKYNEPDLILIGGVDHGHRHISHLRCLTMQELGDVESESNIDLVEYFEINSVGDWYDFYHGVVNHRELEGYVLRLENEQKLVKVKANAYIEKHAFKFQLTPKRMASLWLTYNKPDEAEMVSLLERQFDEEVVMFAIPYLDVLFQAVKQWQNYCEKIAQEANSRLHWSRKDFALFMQDHFKDDKRAFSLAMLMYQTDSGIPDRLIHGFLVEQINGTFSQ